MERAYVSTNLRNLVANRANYCCQYCLIREQDTALGCAVDHIISLKHGGTTAQDNLAYACVGERKKRWRIVSHQGKKVISNKLR